MNMPMRQQFVDSSVLAVAEAFLHDSRLEPQIESLNAEEWSRLARVIAADMHTAIEDAIGDPVLALAGTAPADLSPEPEAA